MGLLDRFLPKKQPKQNKAGICDVCYSAIHDAEGFLLNTQEIVESQKYWKWVLQLDQALRNSGESEVLAELEDLALRFGSHETPWHVCENCISMFLVSRERTAKLAAAWLEDGLPWFGGTLVNVSKCRDLALKTARKAYGQWKSQKVSRNSGLVAICPHCGQAFRYPLSGATKEKQLTSDLDLVSWDRFVSTAMTQGSANSRVLIAKVPEVFDNLSNMLKSKGLFGAQITDLLRYSLMAVCPECHMASTAAGLQIIWVNRNVDGNVILTGDSGGAERWLDGICRNSSCSSKYIILFWCPDKDKKSIAYLTQAGVSVDESASSHRRVIRIDFA
jgi:hypothetical protein